MDHLSTLRVFNYAMAVLNGLATVFSIGITIVIVVLGWPALQRGAGGQTADLPPPEVIGGVVLAIFVMVSLILLVFTVLFVLAARATGRGRGRVLQTVLAILTVTSIPIGTAYGIYALWVCWSNPATKAAFDQGGT